jgi:hypothetical protein
MKINISLLSVLGLIFLVLKLTEVITWAWLWVLLPFYFIPAIIVLAIFGVAIYTLIQQLFKKK